MCVNRQKRENRKTLFNELFLPTRLPAACCTGCNKNCNTVIFEFWQCLLWSYPAAVATPQRFQLHNENCPALPDCMYLLFLICLRSSQKSQAVWLQSLNVCVVHSATPERRPVSRQWARGEGSEPPSTGSRWSPPPELITDVGGNMHLFILYKKGEVFSQPGQNTELPTLRLRLTVAFDFPFSQMLPFSGGRLHVRAVAACRLHLSQWGDRRSLGGSLSSLPGTDAQASKWRGFFSVRQPSVWLKSPGRTAFLVSLPLCQPSAVLSSGASEESVQTTEGSQGSMWSASQFSSLFFGAGFLQRARCLCAAVETCWCLWCSSVLALRGRQPLRLCHKVSWIYRCQFFESITFIVFLGPNIQYWWLEMCEVTGKDGLQMWLEHNSA